MTVPTDFHVETPAAATAEIPFEKGDRDAMRAYLQRTEVRLSTLHRIATAFINGAGLLILFPIFFREEIVTVTRIFIDSVFRIFPVADPVIILLQIVLHVALAFPFVLSVGIPLYAFYLLVKDVIHFYFTIYTPGFSSSLFTPSFVLTGIGFPLDESEMVKRRVLRYEYNPSTIDFMIPFSGQKREIYFDETIYNTNGDILPNTRLYADLAAQGVIAADADRQTVERFNAAFGLARTVDRRLHEEVAVQEMSLVRHVLYLRRLVLRYVGTLLMFVWTALVTFVMLPFLQDGRISPLIVLGVGYLIWALLVMPILRLPIAWIYRHRHGIPKKTHIDRQLVTLQEQVERYVYIAIASAILGIVLAVVLSVR
ncbi:MAG: hypothetical protein ACUVS2_06340 [Candidatus Flexifilum sp.]